MKQYLSISKEIDEKLFDYSGQIEVDFIIKTRQIEGLIENLKTHAADVIQIKTIFNLFLTQEQTNIESLAILIYLLEIKNILLNQLDPSENN